MTLREILRKHIVGLPLGAEFTMHDLAELLDGKTTDPVSTCRRVLRGSRIIIKTKRGTYQRCEVRRVS